jgi:hypothetical protein
LRPKSGSFGNFASRVAPVGSCPESGEWVPVFWRFASGFVSHFWRSPLKWRWVCSFTFSVAGKSGSFGNFSAKSDAPSQFVLPVAAFGAAGVVSIFSPQIRMSMLAAGEDRPALVSHMRTLSSGAPAANILAGLGIDEYLQRADGSGADVALTVRRP